MLRFSSMTRRHYLDKISWRITCPYLPFHFLVIPICPRKIQTAFEMKSNLIMNSCLSTFVDNNPSSPGNNLKAQPYSFYPHGCSNTEIATGASYRGCSCGGLLWLREQSFLTCGQVSVVQGGVYSDLWNRFVEPHCRRKSRKGLGIWQVPLQLNLPRPNLPFLCPVAAPSLFCPLVTHPTFPATFPQSAASSSWS